MEIKNQVFTCDCCNNEFNISEVNYFEDNSYCEECYQDLTCVCVNCDRRIFEEDNNGTDSYPLCESCYDTYYGRCNGCDALIRIDNAYFEEDDTYEESPYCYSCYSERESKNNYIKDYCFKPEPIFYGNENYFLGVELEIDGAGKSKSNARDILNIANKDKEHIYIKSDSSLDSGFEIVTYPMTLEYHKENLNWKGIVNKALELGYYSHKTSTSGLHVHVNRNYLGDSYEEQEEVISKILYLVESFWNELIVFSRRKEAELRRWADRYGRKDNPKETLDNAKNSYGTRYKEINLVNKNTIEFRIFKGTLKYNTLIATLQMVCEICNVAIFMSSKEITKLSWSDFVSKIDSNKNQELIIYLKERRLYVNEILVSEGDEI